ncbi:MAG: tRNA (guanosine(46)-N7)-methyltransferase TrmB [Bacilli bacterium]|nr:tRNA (guanosine(46)-N7)-methyltransferase TrmB [Bacilli bacterium]
MRTKYKPWALPYINEHQEVQVSLDLLSTLDDIYLEIGSGKGQFLVEMAKKNPTLRFIGIERNVTCSGFIAKKLVEEEITNAFLIYNNAEKVLEMMKEKSVNILYLNFSDPWPKTRHHKRRLTSERFCALYKKVLKDDGLIIQKTDNLELFEFSIETFKENGFKILEIDKDYQINDDDVVTEYEADFRCAHLPIYRMKVSL